MKTALKKSIGSWRTIMLLVFAVIGTLGLFYFLRGPQKLVATTVSVATNNKDASGKAIIEQRVLMLPPTLAVRTTNVMAEEEIAYLQGQSEVEICGRGMIKLADLDHLFSMDKSAERAIRDVATRLSISADEVDQALGLSLKIHDSLWGECAINKDCPNTKGLDEDGAAKLVSMAVRTSNPAVYVAALRFCRRTTVSGCEMISAERWTELQPQNAVAWSARAAEAERTHDISSRDYAMQRAAQSTQYDDAILPFERALLLQPANELSLLDQMTASANLFGQYATNMADSFSTAVKYCKADQMLQVGRASECMNLSRLVEKNDHSLLGQALALAIAKNTGLEVDRIAAIQLEHQQLVSSLEQSTAKQNIYSCESAVNLIQYAVESMNGRELSSLRRRFSSHASQTR